MLFFLPLKVSILFCVESSDFFSSFQFFASLLFIVHLLFFRSYSLSKSLSFTHFLFMSSKPLKMVPGSSHMIPLPVSGQVECIRCQETAFMTDGLTFWLFNNMRLHHGMTPELLPVGRLEAARKTRVPAWRRRSSKISFQFRNPVHQFFALNSDFFFCKKLH